MNFQINIKNVKKLFSVYFFCDPRVPRNRKTSTDNNYLNSVLFDETGNKILVITKLKLRFPAKGHRKKIPTTSLKRIHFRKTKQADTGLNLLFFFVTYCVIRNYTIMQIN